VKTLSVQQLITFVTSGSLDWLHCQSTNPYRSGLRDTRECAT